MHTFFFGWPIRSPLNVANRGRIFSESSIPYITPPLGECIRHPMLFWVAIAVGCATLG
jgi:hypothetical protein